MATRKARKPPRPRDRKLAGRLKKSSGLARTGGGLQLAVSEVAGFAFMEKWGSRGLADGQFQTPADLDIAADGSVYVADTENHRIQRFTATGEFLGKWGGQGSWDGRFAYPIDVVVASDGSVYVADQENHRIQRFTPDGDFVGKWGRKGQGDGEFSFPTGLAGAADGSIYVADRDNRRVQRFTADGLFLGKWSFFWGWPTGIAVAPDGSVYVTPIMNSGSGYEVKRFTANGASYPTREGLIRGDVEVDVGSDGSVYITGCGFERYTADGRFLGKWGGPGSGDGQFSADVWDVGAAPDGTVYVADTGNDRIQRFSPTGVLRLCVNDSGFIDVGEHTFTLSPLPGTAPTTAAPEPNVIVPTGGCVTLEFSVNTTVTMIETVPASANWKVANTAVTPPEALRTCETPAPNTVCTQVSLGAVSEVTFTNQRLVPDR